MQLTKQLNKSQYFAFTCLFASLKSKEIHFKRGIFATFKILLVLFGVALDVVILPIRIAIKLYFEFIHLELKKSVAKIISFGLKILGFFVIVLIVLNIKSIIIFLFNL